MSECSDLHSLTFAASRWKRGILAFTLVLLTGTLAYAQRPMPHLGFVYPAGGQQGTTFTVSVGGQTLNNATATYFSGLGVQAKVLGYERPLTQKEINDLREKLQQLQEKRVAARTKPNAPAFTPDDEKLLEQTRTTLATRGNRTTNPALAETVTLQVTVAPDATPGTRELRLKTEAGLSNPMVFCVGTLPEATDPVVVGSANRSARPNFAAGPRVAEPAATESKVSLPVTLNGQILPGEVDRFRFSARKGQRLTLMVAARALLPYLADAVPGWFQPTLAVFDPKGTEVAYADDFRFHPDPVLLCEIPADGEYVVEIKDAIFRGREDFVYRLAMGELPFVTAIFPLGGRAGEDLRVQTSGWNLHRNELLIDTMGRGRGVFDLAVREGTSLSNTVRFSMDEHPAAVEAEPNDSVAQAQAVVLPLTIDGRIATAGDTDVFRFEANAPGVVVAEVMARRLNSPLDSVLELFDQSGQRLAMNDDYEDKGAGLLTHHADSRIEVALPGAGTYFVRVTDAQRHGGPEFGYRLRLGPREPDFALRIVPSTINVRAGGTVTLTAYALRRDDFDGEILIALKDPARGFYIGGGRIPARAESVRLTLTAPPSVSDEPQSLSFVGVATVEGKRVGHQAIPADDLMQAFAYHHLVPSQDMKVQVAGRGSTLRVATRLPVMMVPGGKTRIRISTPQARSVGEVKLELVEPPPGIAVVSCDRGVDYVDVILSCDPTKAKPGTQGNLLFNAIGERSGGSGKQGKGAAKLQRSPLGTVPAIPFDVVMPERST